ncbi:MAG: UbiX family flavin prenyltransferase [Candidatus Altiarchaeales archaeon]|nr:UbiX family flavin prenyltransferase [Candidatus Altiarchaeales archaeon]
MRIVVAITGASGIVLGQILVEELAKQKHEIHLIVSRGAEEVARHEEGIDLSKAKKKAFKVYDEKDLAASLASSSFKIDAMVVIPCSMKTLSGIANGYADNLIARAAENCLKMNWKLIVCPRDTPLSLPALENMRKLKIAGACILPLNMAYYYKPKTVSDVNNFFVGKILDALGLEHSLYRKWGGK